MKVVIIGSGNVATVLGEKIRQAGHSIVQVFSRDPDHAARLAEEWHCPWTTDWAKIDKEAEVYLVALSDSALYSLGKEVQLPGKLVLHTAGAVPKEVLLGVSRHSGVLYPLQSLRKEIRPFPDIPLLIDANDPEDLPRIADLAHSLSQRVEMADDHTRLRLHVAAVIVNNFGNYLYTLSEEYCRREKLDFSLLIPIIQETAGRVEHYSPKDTQTGPAIRQDEATVQRHLQLLQDYNNIRELYAVFTKQIEAFYHPSKILPPL